MRTFYRAMLLVLYSYTALFAVEVLLVAKDHRAEGPHLGFNTQYLHPYYFFSFPRKRELLDKINYYPMGWVDDRGYRGPGPEARGSRKLAFLMGASTAFGEGVAANDDTISANLNRLQEEFFFVNAGVPSWNSFQELLRFLKQVAAEKPALVIDLNGFNDFAVADSNRKYDLPLDTPESFQFLEAWVENIREPRFREAAVLDYLRNLPYVRHLFLHHLCALWKGRKSESDTPIGKTLSLLPEPRSDREIAEGASRTYLENMSWIHELAKARSIQFLALFQPYLFVHKEFQPRSPGEEKLYDPNYTASYSLYRQKVQAQKPAYLDDLSGAFDSFTWMNARRFFVDAVHFNAGGNQEMAKRILERLRVRGLLRLVPAARARGAG